MLTNQAARASRFQITPTIGLILALLIASAMYWPGLYGGYEFDDYPNIVNNEDLHIAAIDAASLLKAALASPSSELKRPLASLSFAANFFITGLDPFWMKLTNLLIHLINGVLVYALALELIRVARRTASSNYERDPRWIALWIAAAWLLLPINLTAVLYVVQRMESLANLFVLLGLLGYVHARQRMLANGRGFAAAVGSIILASGLGLMSKETAVMTPLYAVLIEWALFGARGANQRRDYRIIGLFLLALVIPLVIGLFWQLPRILSSTTWATRNFDLSQRLLTETRIVVDYIRWTLLPTPQALSFYHDDYLISTGWLKPWTTLLCAFILATLTALAISIRKRAPLIALGLVLFLGGQLLTATILPLELVYEHRNYFASFGLLLALIPLLSGNVNQLPAATARYVLLGSLLSLWAAVTLSNASAWGSPLVLSQTLAERAPNSPRAQYGLGYTYIVLSQYHTQSPFTAAAYAPLEKAMRLPAASILPEQALIMMSARMNQPVKSDWWVSMITKLKNRKPTVQDIGSLEALARCEAKKQCALDQDQMLKAFLAALSHPFPSARLLAIYGAYAWNVMHDRTLGANMLAEAVRIAPSQPPYRATLARMLILKGEAIDAEQQIMALEQLNIGGRLNKDLHELTDLRAQLQ